MATFPFDTTNLTVMIRLTEAAASSAMLVPLLDLGSGRGSKHTGLPGLDAALLASLATGSSATPALRIWRICQPISGRRSGTSRSTSTSALLSAALRDLLARTLVIITDDAFVYRDLLGRLRGVRAVELVEAAVGRSPAGGGTSQTPQDEVLGDQWGLTTIGWHELAVAVRDCDAVCDVGIIDTEIRDGSVDLPEGKIISKKDFIGESETDGRNSQHGTAIASILGATMTLGTSASAAAGTGIVGVHPKARIRSAVVLRNTDASNPDTASSAEMSAALTHLADGDSTPLSNPPRARVINVSIAGHSSSDTERCAIYYALSRGSLVVAASGNRGKEQPDYPARYESEHDKGWTHWRDLLKKVSKTKSWRAALEDLSEGLVVVGAVDSDTLVRRVDGTNAVGTRGLVAPGENIHGQDGDGIENTLTGTSYAAPHVSGAASLLLAYRHSKNLPVMTNRALAKALRDSASKDKVEGEGDDTDWCGQGLLDLKRLIEAAE